MIVGLLILVLVLFLFAVISLSWFFLMETLRRFIDVQMIVIDLKHIIKSAQMRANKWMLLNKNNSLQRHKWMLIKDYLWIEMSMEDVVTLSTRMRRLSSFSQCLRVVGHCHTKKKRHYLLVIFSAFRLTSLRLHERSFKRQTLRGKQWGGR